MSMKSGAMLVALAAVLATGSASAAPAFHRVQTAAEQALARILKRDADNSSDVDPAVETRGRPHTTPPRGAPYLKYLTTPLATAILVAQAGLVKTNCGGVYRRGDECGMDADPIICAQDFPDSYLMRTIQSGPGLAVIEAAWPPDAGAEPTTSGVYRLTLTGTVWKIDGIACSAGDHYNWSGR